MKFKSLIVAAALLPLVAEVASATPIFLQQMNPTDIFDNNGRGSVTIKNRGRGTDSNGNPNPRTGRWGQKVVAGGFHISDGVNDLIAWCLDISHKISLPSSYVVTNTPFTNSYGLSRVQQENVEKMFAANYSSLDLTNDHQSAGFQLALWEVVYETKNVFSIRTGKFRAETSWWMGQALHFADQFLGKINNVASENYKVSYYQSTGNSQNLVSVTPVPLPAAGLMLGIGLVGFYCLGRRSKTRNTSN